MFGRVPAQARDTPGRFQARWDGEWLGRLADWQTGCLAGWLAGRQAGWHVEWLAGMDLD